MLDNQAAIKKKTENKVFGLFEYNKNTIFLRTGIFF